ncbi:unnamed protein product [Ectocarpus sp. 8 AP-2014]
MFSLGDSLHEELDDRRDDETLLDDLPPPKFTYVPHKRVFHPSIHQRLIVVGFCPAHVAHTTLRRGKRDASFSRRAFSTSPLHPPSCRERGREGEGAIQYERAQGGPRSSSPQDPPPLPPPRTHAARGRLYITTLQ